MPRLPAAARSPSGFVAPSGAPSAISASLPAGWVLLDPTKDMLPSMSPTGYATIMGLQAVLPLWQNGDDTYAALPKDSATNDVEGVDVSAWSAAEWAVQGAKWLPGAQDEVNVTATFNYTTYADEEVNTRAGGVIFTSYVSTTSRATTTTLSL